MRDVKRCGTWLAAIAAIGAVSGPGCGGSVESLFGDDPNNPFHHADDGGIFIGGDGADAKPCVTGLCKQQVDCPNGGDTTVTGIVYDPAGKVPLYNVVVYVPDAPLGDITTGATCDKCGQTLSGSPLVTALTDASGKFTLGRVPVGDNIPLVVQIGKWRRAITIPNVGACAETRLAAADTRLPRNHTEGNIPLIAITTGGADSIECLPRRMGIDDSEFSTKGGAGRIHLYKGDDNTGDGDLATGKFAPGVGGGATFAPSTDLWSTKDELKVYDIVILSCEGTINPSSKPVTARQALYDYETIGGRVFASHWHRYWFSDGPAPVPSIGSWKDQKDQDQEQNAIVNDSFPKGAAFADWLVNVGASATRKVLPITVARDNLNAVDTTKARDWATIPAYVGATPPPAVQFTSYNAPIGAPDDQICGRAVYTDLHVSSGARNDHSGKALPFPSGCESADLSAQEKAMEFMLFDLASCIQKDDQKPTPPPIR